MSVVKFAIIYSFGILGVVVYDIVSLVIIFVLFICRHPKGDRACAHKYYIIGNETKKFEAKRQ